MQKNCSIPTTEDVTRIVMVKDPVIRNLMITQCYHELSAVLMAPLGKAANWCTFATWASKQAGQSIRKEDLVRLLERFLTQATSTRQASREVDAAIAAQGGRQGVRPRGLPPAALDLRPAVERVSDAVGRGNKKVFEEIGYEFARFYQTCLIDGHIAHEKLAYFCDGLRDGDPPHGQAYLRKAFSHYAEAFVETDSKKRAELILLANIEIGFHEQTRLQPEIAESLDAGLVSFLSYARFLFRSVFPADGCFHLAHLYLKRLLGRPTTLDLAIRAFLTDARAALRHGITGMMMTISFPPGKVLNLGEDLGGDFPESLRHIANQDLGHFLEKYDLTPDNLSGSGAVDWADLPDRLHFILDMFRCYQEDPELFDSPFTAEQVAAVRGGRLPVGKL